MVYTSIWGFLFLRRKTDDETKKSTDCKTHIIRAIIIIITIYIIFQFCTIYRTGEYRISENTNIILDITYIYTIFRSLVFRLNPYINTVIGYNLAIYLRYIVK